MPKQNTYELSVNQVKALRKRNRAVYNKQYRLRKLFDVDTGIERKTQFGSEQEYKAYLKQVREFRKRENFRYVKTDSGVVLPRNASDNITLQINRINKERKARRDKISNVTYKLRGEDTGMTVLERAKMTERKNQKGFTNSKLDDLMEISFDISDYDDISDLEKLLDKYENDDYYNLSKRDENYRNSYIKAIRENFSDIPDEYKEALIEKIEGVDIEKFMMMYYTEDKGDIKSHYDLNDELGHLEELNDLFDEMLK